MHTLWLKGRTFEAHARSFGAAFEQSVDAVACNFPTWQCALFMYVDVAVIMRFTHRWDHHLQSYYADPGACIPALSLTPSPHRSSRDLLPYLTRSPTVPHAISPPYLTRFPTVPRDLPPYLTRSPIVPHAISPPYLTPSPHSRDHLSMHLSHLYYLMPTQGLPHAQRPRGARRSSLGATSPSRRAACPHP